MSQELEPTFFVGNHSVVRFHMDERARNEPAILSGSLSFDIVHRIFDFIPFRQRITLMWMLRQDSPFFAIAFDAQISLWMGFLSFEDGDEIAEDVHHYISQLWHYAFRRNRILPAVVDTVGTPLSIASTMAFISRDIWPWVSAIDLSIPSGEFEEQDLLSLISWCSQACRVTITLDGHEINVHPSSYLPIPSLGFSSRALPATLRVLELACLYLTPSSLAHELASLVSFSLVELYLPDNSDSTSMCSLYDLLRVMPRLRHLMVHVQYCFPFWADFWAFPSFGTYSSFAVPSLETLDLLGNPEQLSSAINHLVTFTVRPLSTVRLTFTCTNTAASYPSLDVLPSFREEMYNYCDTFVTSPVSFRILTSRRLECGNLLSMEISWELVAEHGNFWVCFVYTLQFRI